MLVRSISGGVVGFCNVSQRHAYKVVIGIGSLRSKDWFDDMREAAIYFSNQ